MDLNQQLQAFGGSVFICHGDALELLSELQKKVGLNLTFARDRAVARWCKQELMPWSEAPIGAVLRGVRNREDWARRCYRTMRTPRSQPGLGQARLVSATDIATKIERVIYPFQATEIWSTADPAMQMGSENEACLPTFQLSRASRS